MGCSRLAELFRDAGLNVNTHVNKSKWAGIQRAKDYMILRPHHDEACWPKGKPKLFIFSTCTQFIKELKGYRWAENNSATGRDAPKKENDDALDALRYCIMSRPDAYVHKSDFENPLLAHKKRKGRELMKRRRYA